MGSCRGVGIARSRSEVMKLVVRKSLLIGKGGLEEEVVGRPSWCRSPHCRIPSLDPTTTRSTRGKEVVWKHAIIVGEVAGAEIGRSLAVVGMVRLRRNK